MSRHRFAGLVDRLLAEPSFLSRPMFGAVACYLNGRLVLLLTDRGEPWQGLLVPTEKSAQRSLIRDVPTLRVHPVLKKWLYLPHAARGFAGAAEAVVERIEAGDARIGVESKVGRLPRPRMH